MHGIYNGYNHTSRKAMGKGGTLPHASFKPRHSNSHSNSQSHSLNNSSPSNNSHNVVNIARLMSSLECQKNVIKQIIFYEFNNFDQTIQPCDIMFSDWKKVNDLYVICPLNWLRDEKFKYKFENATFASIQFGLDVYYHYFQN